MFKIGFQGGDKLLACSQKCMLSSAHKIWQLGAMGSRGNLPDSFDCHKMLERHKYVIFGDCHKMFLNHKYMTLGVYDDTFM